MRRPGDTTAATMLACHLVGAAAMLFYPTPVAPVDLKLVDYPGVPPGTMTIEASARATKDASAPDLPAELRVIRIARSGDQNVILQPESGDTVRFALAPGGATLFRVPVPVVADAEETTIAVLAFPDPDRVWLNEIGERQTVSPRGIPPYR